MGRRAKPANVKPDRKRAPVRKTDGKHDTSIRDLETRRAAAQPQLDTRDRDLVEALERQTATDDVLRIISTFPTDVQPVFDVIAAKALDLCRATTGWVYRFDGELIHIAAAHSLRPEALHVVRQRYAMPPSRGGGTARALLSRSIVYILDIRTDPDYRLEALARAADYLSALEAGSGHLRHAPPPPGAAPAPQSTPPPEDLIRRRGQRVAQRRLVHVVHAGVGLRAAVGSSGSSMLAQCWRTDGAQRFFPISARTWRSTVRSVVGTSSSLMSIQRARSSFQTRRSTPTSVLPASRDFTLSLRRCFMPLA